MSLGFQIEREFCDPLYKYIYITKMENNIIDSKEFQRLDRLHQTPSTHFVFPNATHTRKSHSLGVMYLADLSLRRLLYRQSLKMRKKIPPLFVNQFVLGDVEELDDLDDNDLWEGKSFLEILESLRIAALCHDIGHGPFSHIFEDVCNSLNEEGKCRKFDHETMSARIIENCFNKIINDPLTVDDIIDILLGRVKKRMFLTRIIDGTYDIDKLDYVSRDAYHTGAAEYGALDYIRIIDGFRVKNGELLLSRSSLGSIMNSFTATQYMYLNVYYHKTARIFDFMLSEAMHMVPNFLNNLLENLDEFLDTNDYNFIFKIKERVEKTDENNDYRSAYEILKDILERKKKYKNIYQYLLTLDVSSNRDEDLIKLKNEIEEEYKDLNTKIDYSAKVKPIRVDAKDFFHWMRSNSIWDELSHKPKNLSDISKAYFEMLTKSQILFYIYIDRKKVQEGTHRHRIEALCKNAEESLNRIQLV